MKTYQKWAQPRHSLGQRLAASLAAGVLIVGLVPTALFTTFRKKTSGLPAGEKEASPSEP